MSKGPRLGADNHSLGDVYEALDALTGEDLYRLAKAAARLCGDLPIEPRDLVHETAVRFRDGRRNWTRSYPFVVVFRGAMRSVADEIRDDEAVAPFGSKTEEEAESLEERLHDSETPEQQLLAQRLLKQLESDFADDENVRRVIDGRVEGRTAEEVQNRNGMSADEYDAARKRLMRWYEKVANEGAES